MQKVLITGGSGLVGMDLSKKLIHAGFEVTHLSRSVKKDNQYPVYSWDVSKGIIDPKAIENVFAIIHLAGANLSEKRWSGKRWAEIKTSRIDALEMIRKQCVQQNHFPKVLISASAIGFYGDQGDQWLNEDAVKGDDRVADLCEKWENKAMQFAEHGVRTSVFRVSLVLSNGGGALPKMVSPARLGIGGIIGNGKQFYPWIHLEDMSRMLLFALTNDAVKGIYNANAPIPLRQKEFAKVLSKALNRPFIPLPAPKIMLRLAMGEMADLILASTRTSSEKIRIAGFDFRYTDLDTALKEILSK